MRENMEQILSLIPPQDLLQNQVAQPPHAPADLHVVMAPRPSRPVMYRWKRLVADYELSCNELSCNDKWHNVPRQQETRTEDVTVNMYWPGE